MLKIDSYIDNKGKCSNCKRRIRTPFKEDRELSLYRIYIIQGDGNTAGMCPYCKAILRLPYFMFNKYVIKQPKKEISKA